MIDCKVCESLDEAGFRALKLAVENRLRVLDCILKIQGLSIEEVSDYNVQKRRLKSILKGLEI